MSVDEYMTEYHLTPTGWVAGTLYYYGKRSGKEIAPPADRVLTLIEHMTQWSRFSKGETSWIEQWRSPSVTDAELADLQKKFPRP